VTTRGIEIGKAIREELKEQGDCFVPTKRTVDIRFFFYRTAEGSSSYEYLVQEAGFDFETFNATIDNEMWQRFLEAERDGLKGFFPPPYQEKTGMFIQSVIDSLRNYCPTLVLHGFYPEVSIATKILNIPTIEYGPIPMHDPDWAQKRLIFPKQNKHPVPTLILAAKECGLDPSLVPTLMKPNECLVCDLPSFYSSEDMGLLSGVYHFVGPVFHHSTKEVDQSIIELLRNEDDEMCRVLVTMSSSGEKYHLIEAVKAVARGTKGHFKGVVYLPSSICSLQDVKKAIGDDSNPDVLVSDHFLPLFKIAQMVDVVVCHGGQGSIQTSLACGKPIVAVPMQIEQRYNIQNAVNAGACIGFLDTEWKEALIREAIFKVKNNPSYKLSAERLKDEIRKEDGRKNAAKCVLRFIASHCESQE